jgi:hypothetical protein
MDINSSIQLAINAYALVLQYCLPYIATVMMIHLTVRLVINAIWNGGLFE